MLENMEERLLHMICESLKLVSYKEYTYIVREGEPIDTTYFITSLHEALHGPTQPVIIMVKQLALHTLSVLKRVTSLEKNLYSGDWERPLCQTYSDSHFLRK